MTPDAYQWPARPCPTCGPTTTEQHPHNPDVCRCTNCKEWLQVDMHGPHIAELRQQVADLETEANTLAASLRLAATLIRPNRESQP